MKYLIKRFGFVLMISSSLTLFVYNKFSPTAFYSIFTLSMLLIAVLEKAIPYNRQWNNSDDVKQDAFYAALNILTAPLSKVISTYIVINFDLSQTLFTHTGSIQQMWWQVLLGLVLSGFLPYWYHRISHTRSSLLWKIHAIHHSPQKVYWLNGLRLHPINAFLNAFLSLFPLVLLGFPKEIMLTVGFINNYVSILNHANIDFKLGILNFVFNTNAVHRWHHSKNIKEGNNNYSGGALIIWDWIFGTFFYSKRKMNITELGLYDESKTTFPYQSLKKQMCLPFCNCVH